MRSARLSTRNYPHVRQAPVQVMQSAPMPRWKRMMDIALCLLALPILALVTLAMTIVMKLISPGPVFFRQERVGYLGRNFMIFKFRTMRVGADPAVHRQLCEQLIGSNAPMSKMDARDNRVIPGGKLIRASGLDELPQILNVLRGEMSWVGPRPCVPYEYEKYLPWQRERSATLPGLTGLWQVSGKNRTTFEEMIRLDIEYAHHRSLWLDLKIMLLTPVALIQQVRDSRAKRRTAAQINPTPSRFRSLSSR